MALSYSTYTGKYQCYENLNFQTQHGDNLFHVYCAPFQHIIAKYGMGVHRNIIKLNKSLHEVARIITGLHKFPNLELLYFETGWEPLHSHRKSRKCNMLNQIRNNNAMSYLFYYHLNEMKTHKKPAHIHLHSKRPHGQCNSKVNECFVNTFYVTVGMKQIHEPRHCIYKLRSIDYNVLISGIILSVVLLKYNLNCPSNKHIKNI
jgi:hypothetical protein